MKNFVLRRYTDIPALIYLLKESKITLLDPQFWDYKNDSNYLSIYKNRKKLKSVLVLCFTQSQETYHHWRVFAGGAAGICIQFHRNKLLDAINDFKKENKSLGTIRMHEVQYMRLKDIGIKRPQLGDLPFLKRYAFSHENEFRIIFESKKEKISNFDIPINLTFINKIILSPWINEALANKLIPFLKSIRFCKGIQICAQL